jgi:hypothetical protein
MHVEKRTISITTAADGSATAYTDGIANGRVLAVIYTKTNFDNGSTMTLTSETTGQSIWAESNVNASAVRYPRAGVHDVVGVAATLDGTRLVRDYVHVCEERLKVIVASGGNAKTGTLTILVG